MREALLPCCTLFGTGDFVSVLGFGGRRYGAVCVSKLNVSGVSSDAYMRWTTCTAEEIDPAAREGKRRSAEAIRRALAMFATAKGL